MVRHRNLVLNYGGHWFEWTLGTEKGRESAVDVEAHGSETLEEVQGFLKHVDGSSMKLVSRCRTAERASMKQGDPERHVPALNNLDVATKV